MAAGQRYTGLNFYVLFGTTVISNDATDVQIEVKTRTDERTAGNDADASFNPTIKEGNFTIKLFDTGEFGTALQTALRIQAAQNLYLYPKGQGTGKTVIAMPVLITDYKITVKPDKNVEVEIKGLKNGAMINDFGTVQ